MPEPTPESVPPLPRPSPAPAARPPIPHTGKQFAFEPMTDAENVGGALNALLKRPGSLVFRLNQPGTERLLTALAIATLACLLIEGLIIGSFSGHEQWWAAPLKVIIGTFLSALICLPSLYIFTCLSGADIRLVPLCNVLLATLCLNALLLLGFAPVVWVFSQSTDSVAFIGSLHLGFWGISMAFALRLLSAHMKYVGSGETGYLRLWFTVFVLVCLQMTTALRPIVGRSNTFLPPEKRFFLSAWGSNLNSEAETSR